MLLHLTLYDQSSSTLSTCIHLITNLCGDSIEVGASILCRPHYGLYGIQNDCKVGQCMAIKRSKFSPHVEKHNRNVLKIKFSDKIGFHRTCISFSLPSLEHSDHNQITWVTKIKSICHKRKENGLNCPFQNQTFVTNLDIHKLYICQRTV